MKIWFDTTRRRLFLACVLVLMVAVCAPTAPTRAQTPEPEPDWLAVAITVDFSRNPARFGHTVYAGKNGPFGATILKWRHTDITNTCVYHGNFGTVDANGYLAFDGLTNYIECTTPGIADEWADMYPNQPLEAQLTCPCQAGAPLFASADVKLGSGNWGHPVIAAPTLGMTYSLTRNGNLARSRIDIGGAYSSATWTPTASNQLLIGGMNGPAIIAAADKFGWLDYLNPAWVTPFTGLFGLNMGHWYQSPGNYTNVSPVPTVYQISTSPQQVYIGYNPNTGRYFKGSIRQASIDPGCPAS